MNAPLTHQPKGSNQAWVERRAKAVSRGIGMAAPVMVAKAENAELWDIEGNRYIDFGGGIAVVNTGHRHPKVMKRVYEQLEKVTHTCAMVMPYEAFIEVCEKLNAVAPISGEKKTALVTTGAEAVENAIKYARAYTGRSDVIAFHGGFHGRTLLGMALTGKVAPYKLKFGPMPSGIWHVPFPIESRGISVEDSIHAIEMLFKADVEPSRVAAIIIEPVQGEGGFYAAPKELMQRLRKLCDGHGIVLIADEIQSGFGRTGKFFAMEHMSVEPDLMTAAKSLAGGFPLAAVVGRAAIMDTPDPGTIGGTYAGNPIACAAALGVFEVFETEDILGKAQKQGEIVVKRLAAMKAKNKGMAMGDVRGLGAMCAFD
ncbi:MAG: aminotransferase class III-fold pyridoxal phosphate-dependent enzyme, partial [Pseudomonadota bacterium]|nr:aminotransferase class III-fold pyridoxal phosphate-dependent enzyme [Pseudomonadota bacterium]